jgi:hypothetical protein
MRAVLIFVLAVSESRYKLSLLFTFVIRYGPTTIITMMESLNICYESLSFQLSNQTNTDLSINGRFSRGKSFALKGNEK